ncbi:hypothetical protein [Methanomassiliicoccus luminyensis]|uniref:hypothetical protein n=1 Tax=Methanomassiliicoccus luminyensis TaxID=1080712 RepID=UPI001F457960|nr:hypothetical protein [Methanomassiliicoccus luminyensis]
MNFPDIMREIGYAQDDGTAVKAVNTLDDVDHGEIAIWQMNDWTVIFDPDMSISMMDEELRKLSEIRATTVFVMGCSGSVGSYWFSLYENGITKRKFAAYEGEIEENKGTQLTVERGKDNEWMTDEEGMIGVTAAVTGIDAYSIPDFVRESKMLVGKFVEK